MVPTKGEQAVWWEFLPCVYNKKTWIQKLPGKAPFLNLKAPKARCSGSAGKLNQVVRGSKMERKINQGRGSGLAEAHTTSRMMSHTVRNQGHQKHQLCGGYKCRVTSLLQLEDWEDDQTAIAAATTMADWIKRQKQNQSWTLTRKKTGSLPKSQYTGANVCQTAVRMCQNQLCMCLAKREK